MPTTSLLTSGLFSLGRSFYNSLSWGPTVSIAFWSKFSAVDFNRDFAACLRGTTISTWLILTCLWKHISWMTTILHWMAERTLDLSTYGCIPSLVMSVLASTKIWFHHRHTSRLRRNLIFRSMWFSNSKCSFPIICTDLLWVVNVFRDVNPLLSVVVLSWCPGISFYHMTLVHWDYLAAGPSALTDQGPYEFAVSLAGDDYIDLANTYLFVEAQNMNDDDTAMCSVAWSADVWSIFAWRVLL
jgi:hypothetical protein